MSIKLKDKALMCLSKPLQQYYVYKCAFKESREHKKPADHRSSRMFGPFMTEKLYQVLFLKHNDV